MPFTFKLSKRLARLKPWMAIAATLSAAACELARRSLTDAAVLPLIQITTTPDSATLGPGQTRQFFAYGRTLAGDSVAVPVHWSASGGAVNGAGLYTAGDIPGIYNITATALDTPLVANSRVAVLSVVTSPRTVTDLAVVGTTDRSVTLSFTEVSDGTGGAASYFVRFAPAPLAWASATDVAHGTCAVPVSGTAVGIKRTCTVFGLASQTGYQLQLVAFRGTLNVDAVFGALSNIASGTTAASTDPVASVTVTPTMATVVTGSTLQLLATLRDASGNVLTGRAVTWTSSNGLLAGVSTAGLVSGIAPGSTTITASSEGKSGAATLTITSGGTGAGTWPNEPAGMTLLSDYGFNDLVPATNQGDRLGTSGWRVWWNTAGRGTHALDASAPHSPVDVFQIHYPIGFLSGLEPTMLEYVFPTGVRELYWAFWWKPSNPFQSDGSGVNKIAFIWTPSGNTDLLYFDLSPNPWRIRGMDNLHAGGGPDAGRRNEPNVTTTVITLGQWHRIEIYVKYSSGANADGILKWWVNGVLNGHYTNLKMVQDGGFDHVQFAPTFGGNTGDTKRQNDYYWLDHVRMSRGP